MDKAPPQMYATLLAEGTYLCSISTMYRTLERNRQVKDRRRGHPSAAKVPELLATAPRQVYPRDIAELDGLVKGPYFGCYVMIDIYSRFIVGAHVYHTESAALAVELMTGTTTMITGTDRIGLHTPSDVHDGVADETAQQRSQTVHTARLRHPTRSATTHDPTILELPAAAWINKPQQQEPAA